MKASVSRSEDRCLTPAKMLYQCRLPSTIKYALLVLKCRNNPENSGFRTNWRISMISPIRSTSGISRIMACNMFETALQLRAGVRCYLEFDPVERRKNQDAVRSLNKAMHLFPLVAEARSDRMALRGARGDALAGLSLVVAELYDGSVKGILDRLKMCAAEECRRVFFDRSKPATRRWCMSTLCGNRIKTRTYRERHRGVG